MTVVTVCSSRLKDDEELTRSIRMALASLDLTVTSTAQQLDGTMKQGDHTILVVLPLDCDTVAMRQHVEQELSRLFNHVPPRREVIVKFEATNR